MLQLGWSYYDLNYRFGYNAGSEKDDEITGVTGSHYTTFYRELDTRVTSSHGHVVRVSKERDKD